MKPPLVQIDGSNRVFYTTEQPEGEPGEPGIHAHFFEGFPAAMEFIKSLGACIQPVECVPVEWADHVRSIYSDTFKVIPESVREKSIHEVKNQIQKP